MPEVYGLDPATRRYRLRDTVIQLPLDGASVTYNPMLNAFYLNNVPSETAAFHFGPVEGDPFEMFKLEELMDSRFRKDYAGDDLYRVRLMIRSGHPKLRERALRIMTAALAPEIGGSIQSYHVGKFRELTSELKGNDVAPVLAAIQQTEKQIEALTDAIPDYQYSPGNEALEKQGKLQDWMKPSVAVAESAWGSPVEGLRVAAVFSSVTPDVGQKIAV